MHTVQNPGDGVVQSLCQYFLGENLKVGCTILWFCLDFYFQVFEILPGGVLCHPLHSPPPVYIYGVVREKL